MMMLLVLLLLLLLLSFETDPPYVWSVDMKVGSIRRLPVTHDSPWDVLPTCQLVSTRENPKSQRKFANGEVQRISLFFVQRLGLLDHFCFSTPIYMIATPQPCSQVGYDKSTALHYSSKRRVQGRFRVVLSAVDGDFACKCCKDSVISGGLKTAN